MFHITKFTPDQTRMGEFLACLWHGPVPDDLVLHKWIYLEGEPRAMLILWEGDAGATAYVNRAFGSFGSLESEEAMDATNGLATCFARDLDGFGDFLAGRGSSADEIAAQLDLRRRGLEAPTLEAAAAAGRAWQAERT